MTDLMTKTPPASRPAASGARRRLSREEVAAIELGHTAISRRTATLLVIGFLLTILSVPFGQHVVSLLNGSQSDQSVVSVLPPIYDVHGLVPSLDQIKQVRSWREAYALLPSPEQIKAFETNVEEHSTLARWLIPRVQWMLTAMGGSGNEQALVGRNGWLFYKPAVDYLTGPPFLDEQRLARIARFEDRSADPLPAIVQLNAQLAERGITLVLMPTPGKAQVHPEQLASGFDGVSAALQNPSYERFMVRLREADVMVYDPGPLLMQRKQLGESQYLATDTHWSPKAMQAVAEQIAEQLADKLPSAEQDRYAQQHQTVSNLGDVAVMLKLPESQTLYKPQEITIAPVQVEGVPWTATPNAPVLLLGDSFSNIYSQAELGWGEGAGLAEQLSFALKLPLDRIVINAGGAHATRQRLAAELARTPQRLDGVRVVLWQFAQRELLAGDWKPIPLPPITAAQAPAHPIAAEQITVRGVIRAIGRPPEPGTVPYRDCLVAVHLESIDVLEGQSDATEVLVFIHGMRNNRLTDAARWSIGQRVELTLQPWENTSQQIQSTQQAMTGTDADFMITSWWFAPIMQGVDRPQEPGR